MKEIDVIKPNIFPQCEGCLAAKQVIDGKIRRLQPIEYAKALITIACHPHNYPAQEVYIEPTVEFVFDDKSKATCYGPGQGGVCPGVKINS
jgi:hypothetical protein